LPGWKNVALDEKRAWQKAEEIGSRCCFGLRLKRDPKGDPDATPKGDPDLLPALQKHHASTGAAAFCRGKLHTCKGIIFSSQAPSGPGGEGVANRLPIGILSVSVQAVSDYRALPKPSHCE